MQKELEEFDLLPMNRAILGIREPTPLSTQPLFIEPYSLLSCLQESPKDTYPFLAALIYGCHWDVSSAKRVQKTHCSIKAYIVRSC